jgi:hypothetical protein
MQPHVNAAHFCLQVTVQHQVYAEHFCLQFTVQHQVDAAHLCLQKGFSYGSEISHVLKAHKILGFKYKKIPPYPPHKRSI